MPAVSGSVRVEDATFLPEPLRSRVAPYALLNENAEITILSKYRNRSRLPPLVRQDLLDFLDGRIPIVIRFGKCLYTKTGRPTKQEIDYAVQRLKKGESIFDIAIELGRRPTTIRRWYRQHVPQKRRRRKK